MVDKVDSATFARVFGLRAKQLAWLVGAGTSAAAGIPTGWDMILDFKASLYAASTGLSRREVDTSDEVWIERLTGHFDGSNGMPAAGDPTEYAAAFEMAFPLERDRRQYIENAVLNGTPTFAHRVLSALISEGLCRCIFTTNFDPLIERSTVLTDDLLSSAGRHLTVAALDSADRAGRCLRDDAWPLLAKLHGDYQSDSLKNTTAELRAQDERLRAVLTESLRRFGLVVVGYSGRDDSVMDALETALASAPAFPAGLWWVSRPGSRPLPRVARLLEAAEQAGVEAHLVLSENFDELAGDLEAGITLDERLRAHIDLARAEEILVPAPLPTVHAGDFPVLRCSALEVLRLPESARTVRLGQPVTSRTARERVREADVWATTSARGRVVSAFGADDDLRTAFAELDPEVDGVVRLDGVADSTDRGLLLEAFARALTRRRPLRMSFHRGDYEISVRPLPKDRTDVSAREQRASLATLQDAYKAPLVGPVPGTDLQFAEAVQVRLEYWDGRWFCVYEPFTRVALPPRPLDDDPRAAATRQALIDVTVDWRRERWAQRYNPHWNNIIAAWAHVLAPEAVTTLTAHHFNGSGVNATFELSRTTAWSRPGGSSKQ